MCQPNYQYSFLGKPSRDNASSVLADDGHMLRAFAPIARKVEENIELYFLDLAAATENHAGDLFNDETHANFYVAAREVISQGLSCQLEFLRDNAPQAFALLLRESGVQSLSLG